MWSGEIFLRIFLPYPPPANIPGLKRGDLETYQLNRKYIVADQVFIGTENEKLKQA
jgi:hypothetical protein